MVPIREEAHDEAPCVRSGDPGSRAGLAISMAAVNIFSATISNHAGAREARSRRRPGSAMILSLHRPFAFRRGANDSLICQCQVAQYPVAGSRWQFSCKHGAILFLYCIRDVVSRTI